MPASLKPMLIDEINVTKTLFFRVEEWFVLKPNPLVGKASLVGSTVSKQSSDLHSEILLFIEAEPI
jgi:hypothetical protein